MSANNPRHSRFFWRSSAMFGILDQAYRFKEVNTSWENILGLSTSQLLAKRFTEFVHTDDQASTKYYLDQLNEGMRSISFSNQFRHYDNSYRSILWEINAAASADYAYYVVGMDITSREQPMIADEMISVLREGVVLQYANGTIGACNPSAEHILGLSADQMMGWVLIDPDWRLIHEDDSPFPTETHPAICTLRTGQSYADVVMGIVTSDATV
ncbi:PAS domain S-box protein, partial [Thiotrichales bacterium HSG1]|nr:PAS domain S-box protein [Thiotrichales bacterium HSG1]